MLRNVSIPCAVEVCVSNDDISEETSDQDDSSKEETDQGRVQPSRKRSRGTLVLKKEIYTLLLLQYQLLQIHNV